MAEGFDVTGCDSADCADCRGLDSAVGSVVAHVADEASF